MIVGVPRETYPGERRVGLVPIVIPNLAKAGLEVIVEAGAGARGGFPGCRIRCQGREDSCRSRAKYLPRRTSSCRCFATARMTRPASADLPLFRRDQVLIGFLRPMGSLETIQEIAATGVTSFSVELMPRTTRAQSMDALSSMGTMCGYKAVLIAADTLPENFPHVDHCRGNDHTCARSGDRRGRGRTSGDRYGAQAGRGGFRLRFAPRGERAGAKPRRAFC